ncbi:kinase-like domain-containing protein [Thamnidium elegans]|nr:kinase-like domain-containing protein [Thamnidium elegans]
MTLTTSKPLLNGRYEVREEIGTGGYGIVKSAYDHKLKQLVALKIEHFHGNSLDRERKVYRSLGCFPGFAQVYDYFEHGDSKYLVMTMLGPSIQNKFYACQRRFNLKTTLIIADQLIDRIKSLHSSCYVHRDIKPSNIALGTGRFSNTVYLLDFGLSLVFKRDNKHLGKKYHDKMIGTPRYASIHSHEGIELSRRDDLESLAYTLIYLQNGTLPWQGLSDTTDDSTHFKIHVKKKRCSPEDICKGLEPEFCRLLTYSRNLRYSEKPDYPKLKQMFKDLYNRKGYAHDGLMQWSPVCVPGCVFGLRKKQAPVKNKGLKKEKPLKKKTPLKRKREEKKAQEEPDKKKITIPPPADALFFPSFVPIDVRRKVVVENMLQQKPMSISPTVTPEPGMVPSKPKTRKEKTAELTALAQKQAQQEQLFYSLYNRPRL